MWLIIPILLLQDFDYFPTQRDLYIGTNKYLADMMIVLSGDRWKAMRTLATPVFTSGKLKSMVPLIDKVSAMPDFRILQKYWGIIICMHILNTAVWSIRICSIRIKISPVLNAYVVMTSSLLHKDTENFEKNKRFPSTEPFPGDPYRAYCV